MPISRVEGAPGRRRALVGIAAGHAARAACASAAAATHGGFRSEDGEALGARVAAVLAKAVLPSATR